MINYLSKTFGLTQKGAKDLYRSIISTVIADIVLMFPVGLYFLLLYLLINPLLGGEFIEPNLGIFIILILIIAGLIFITQWKHYSLVYVTTYAESVQKRINLGETLRKLPLSFFGRKDLSDLTMSIMGDCTDLEHVFSHAIPQLVAALISIIIVAIFLLIFDYKLAISLLWVVPVSFLIMYFSKSSQESIGKHMLQVNRKTSDNILECIELVRELKAYNYEEEYLEKLDNQIDFAESEKFKSEIKMSVGVVLAQMVLKVGIVSLMLCGTWLLLTNQVEIFSFIIFLIVASVVFTPLENATLYLAEIFSSFAKIKNMKNIEEQVPSEGITDYTLEKYDIEFNNVSFSYDDSEEVLEDINFIAKQGEVTALVGPSGSGKSTVSKLVAKFWNPTGGFVTLGGHDLHDLDSEKLLENYSIVFQEVILFNKSIMENIRIGKKDATDEEVIKAAQIAQCEDFVSKLPEGYDTVIGENGVLLSGGERQRISIARAILKDAPIILLDEATSYLDVENESRIQQALSNLIKDKTVIIIAHRMRTIASADKIIVLKEGRIVEMGKPQELLEKEGMFSHMVNIQNKSSNWKI